MRPTALSLIFLFAVTTSLHAQSGSRGSAIRGGSARAMSPAAPRSVAAPRAGRGGSMAPAITNRRASGLLNSVRTTPRRSPSAAPYRSYGGGARAAATRPGNTSGVVSLRSGSARPSSTKRAPTRPNSAVPVGQLDSDLRLWTDNTGKYQIRGRLLLYRDDTVWIRREDGLLSMLPINKLSPHDRQAIRQFADKKSRSS